jgi:hypothetical protein
MTEPTMLPWYLAPVLHEGRECAKSNRTIESDGRCPECRFVGYGRYCEPVASEPLSDRESFYVRKLASQGGLPWARAPRMFERFLGLGLVTKGIDSETGCEYAFATDACKDLAKSMKGTR